MLRIGTTPDLIESLKILKGKTQDPDSIFDRQEKNGLNFAPQSNDLMTSLDTSPDVFVFPFREKILSDGLA